MNRRPWLGVGFSLAFHAGLLTLLLLAVWRDESLPALIVDLREGFAPGAAAIRSLASEIRHARETASAALAPRRRVRTSAARGSEATQATPPATSEPSAPPQPLAPSPEPAMPLGQSPPPLPSAPALLVAPSAPRPSAPLAEAPAVPPTPPRIAVATPPRESPLLATGGSGTTANGTSTVPGVAPGATSTGSSARAGTGGPPASGWSAAAAPAGGMVGVLSTGPDHGAAGRSQGAGATGPIVAAATTGGGSGVGAEYGPYLTALRQRIQQSLRYPPSARRRGVSGTVNVEILILANGAVSNVIVLESSAHSVLDEAALDAIRSLPRMPLPPDVPPRPLRVRVPVVFEIR